MTLRCTASPTRSGRPVAIARLHGWKWFICERGCANVAYTGKANRAGASYGDANGDGEDEVWGVLYDMSVEDEETLDRYEHVDWAAPETDTETSQESRGVELVEFAGVRPTEQGKGHHNKVYVQAEIMEWKAKEWEGQQQRHWVTVLVYVDEYRLADGEIRENYIGRMNRGIQEAVALGLSEEWVARVVRPWVPEGIDPPPGFVGVI